MTVNRAGATVRRTFRTAVNWFAFPGWNDFVTS